MEKEFIPYEEALTLKELGFDELCFAHYCNGNLITKTAILKSSTMLYYQQNNINPNNQYKHQNCTAPLYQQAFRWFRENYNIDFTIITNYAKVNSKMIKSYRVGITFVKNNIIDSFFLRPKNNTFKFIEFKTYKKAELECLKKLIEIVKNK